MLADTAIDMYRENEQAQWTRVAATITQASVVQAPSGRRTVWYIQSEVRYRVNGEELTSNVHSRSTSSTDVRGNMRVWVAEHRPGTTIPVCYDPRHPSAVVADGDMPESGTQVPGDLKATAFFLLLFIATMSIVRWLRYRSQAAS